MRYMSIGHKVIVNIPKEDKTNFPMLMKYQGQEMVIANRVSLKHATDVYYELVGAESEYGIPYGFVRQWLQQK